MPIASVDDDTRDCPMCAEKIKAKAKVCRFCGHDLFGLKAAVEDFAAAAARKTEPVEEDQDEEDERERDRDKFVRGRRRNREPSGSRVVHVHHHQHGSATNAGMAAVLSFFFLGVGQIYAGRVARGLALMVIGPTVFFGMFFMGAAAGRDAGPVMILAAGGFSVLFWLWNVFDAYSCAQDAARPNGSYRRSRRR